MLFEEEGEEHQKTSVVHNPPDINVALMHSDVFTNKVNIDLLARYICMMLIVLYIINDAAGKELLIFFSISQSIRMRKCYIGYLLSAVTAR